MISNTQITAQPEYDIQFWNAMREKYLTQKLGKSFGKAEDNAFINGTGADESAV